ncbi:hypothetical protein C0Q70_20683 [Pomacea canaliculata]|uniref:Uncharacterized protein n=1 Tax=Pomacea canaliculata TaxID=400727 RepID=A0A2T7NG78_POMCA|nr:hypothetical protein C0Q70_20683 [Pomacea canaliculata]
MHGLSNASEIPKGTGNKSWEKASATRPHPCPTCEVDEECELEDAVREQISPGDYTGMQGYNPEKRRKKELTEEEKTSCGGICLTEKSLLTVDSSRDASCRCDVQGAGSFSGHQRESYRRPQRPLAANSEGGD